MTYSPRFSHGADRLIMFTIRTPFHNKIISNTGAINIPLQPYLASAGSEAESDSAVFCCALQTKHPTLIHKMSQDSFFIVLSW